MLQSGVARLEELLVVLLPFFLDFLLLLSFFFLFFLILFSLLISRLSWLVFFVLGFASGSSCGALIGDLRGRSGRIGGLLLGFAANRLGALEELDALLARLRLELVLLIDLSSGEARAPPSLDVRVSLRMLAQISAVHELLEFKSVILAVLFVAPANVVTLPGKALPVDASEVGEYFRVALNFTEDDVESLTNQLLTHVLVHD